jgi:hypothetical protein
LAFGANHELAGVIDQLRHQFTALEGRVLALENGDQPPPPPEGLEEMVPLVAEEFKKKYGIKVDKYQRRYLHLWQRPGHGLTLVYRISGETGTANHRALVPEGGNTLAADNELKEPVPEQIVRAFEQAIRRRQNW